MAVVDGSGVVINVDVLDVNKGSKASHLLTWKDLVAGKLHVPFLVRLLSIIEMSVVCVMLTYTCW